MGQKLSHALKNISEIKHEVKNRIVAEPTPRTKGNRYITVFFCTSLLSLWMIRETKSKEQNIIENFMKYRQIIAEIQQQKRQ